MVEAELQGLIRPGREALRAARTEGILGHFRGREWHRRKGRA